MGVTFIAIFEDLCECVIFHKTPKVLKNKHTWIGRKFSLLTCIPDEKYIRIITMEKKVTIITICNRYD